MKVEYTRAEPAGFSLVTYASSAPFRTVRKAPAVTGKSAEAVSPVTYALPEESTAIPRASSISLTQSREVEYTSAEANWAS
jgi:hypothetical protein